MKSKTAYTASQWKKGDGSSRCRDCVEASTKRDMVNKEKRVAVGDIDASVNMNKETVIQRLLTTFTANYGLDITPTGTDYMVTYGNEHSIIDISSKPASKQGSLDHEFYEAINGGFEYIAKYDIDMDVSSLVMCHAQQENGGDSVIHFRDLQQVGVAGKQGIALHDMVKYVDRNKFPNIDGTGDVNDVNDVNDFFKKGGYDGKLTNSPTALVANKEFIEKCVTHTNKNHSSTLMLWLILEEISLDGHKLLYHNYIKGSALYALIEHAFRKKWPATDELSWGSVFNLIGKILDRKATLLVEDRMFEVYEDVILHRAERVIIVGKDLSTQYEASRRFASLCSRIIKNTDKKTFTVYLADGKTVAIIEYPWITCISEEYTKFVDSKKDKPLEQHMTKKTLHDNMIEAGASYQSTTGSVAPEVRRPE